MTRTGRLLAVLLGVLVVAVIWRYLPETGTDDLPSAGAQVAPAPQSAAALEVGEAGATPVAVDAPPSSPTADDEQPLDYVDIDPADAFRVSPSQREEDSRHLRAAADLGDYGADLSDRALKGDADAAQSLADLLRHCGMAFDSAQWDADAWQYFRVYAQLDEAQLQAAAQAMVAEQSRCSAFGQSDPEWYEWQAEQWNNLAAQLGHPVAIAEQRPDPLRTDEARRAYAESQRAVLARALDESGAQALARHAVAMAGVSGLRHEAFAIAACMANPVCAADPQDYPLRLWHSGQTASDAVIVYMSLRMMTPRERQIAEGQAQHILRLWRAGRFAELLAAQTPLAPGWP